MVDDASHIQLLRNIHVGIKQFTGKCLFSSTCRNKTTLENVCSIQKTTSYNQKTDNSCTGYTGISRVDKSH